MVFVNTPTSSSSLCLSGVVTLISTSEVDEEVVLSTEVDELAAFNPGSDGTLLSG